MRALNEIEMNVVTGGVDPIPVWVPERMPRQDPEEVYWLLQKWANLTYEFAPDGRFKH